MRFRSTRGQQLSEMAAGLIIVVPILLVIADLLCVFMAVTINDNCCRDAARAASSVPAAASDAKGPLSSSSPIYIRAATCVDQAKTGGYLVGPKLENVLLSSDFAPPSNLKVGGRYEGSVEVRTTITLKLPAWVPGVVPEMIDFKSAQSFPLTGHMDPQVKPL